MYQSHMRDKGASLKCVILYIYFADAFLSTVLLIFVSCSLPTFFSRVKNLSKWMLHLWKFTDHPQLTVWGAVSGTRRNYRTCCASWLTRRYVAIDIVANTLKSLALSLSLSVCVSGIISGSSVSSLSEIKHDLNLPMNKLKMKQWESGICESCIKTN